MKGNAWFVFLATATLQCGITVFAAWVLWINFTADERAVVATLWVSYAGMPILAGLLLLLLLGLGINLMFRWYINPLHAITEEVKVIALSHPGHRLTTEGRPELQALIDSLNLLAERYQQVQDDVEARIREANISLEEEKSTLAALMAKLTQGVVVCNREGTILLYNERAQYLLASAAEPEDSGWIGLGRSIYGELDEDLIQHALLHIQQRLQQGELRLMAPFVASRRGGQLLNVNLVPVLDSDHALNGYILTFQDITQRAEAENRRGDLLQALTEGQRSAIAGIRAAIETMLEYPEMDEANSRSFQMIIRDESLKLSEYVNRIMIEYANDLQVQWPLEKMLAGDLLAVIGRRVNNSCGIRIKISVPVQPLWLKVDSYAIAKAMVFIIGKLIGGFQARELELSLEAQDTFAGLDLSWRGKPLDMETLRSWDKQDLSAKHKGNPLTLHEVIDRHGSAVWTYTGIDCCHARFLLPLPGKERPESESGNAAIRDQAYDFKLFQASARPSQLDAVALSELHYTVIDTETTGLDPAGGDEIIAIGAVRIVNGRILKQEVFDCLIDPRRPISQAAMMIHGISNKMLRGQPTIDKILPRLHRYVEDTVIVGHNIAFDMRFLDIKQEQTGIKFTNPVLDTLLLAAVVHANQDEQSLEALAQRLGIPIAGRHTAVGDALTTAQVFLAMLPLLEEKGLRTLQEVREAAQTTDYAQIKY